MSTNNTSRSQDIKPAPQANAFALDGGSKWPYRVVGFDATNAGTGQKGKWVEASKREPCAICGDTKWCGQTEDGRIADCKQVADPSKGYYKSQGEHNYHRLRSDEWERAPKRVRRATPEADVPPADPATRHAAYDALLSAATLSDDHRAAMAARGFDEAMIESGRYGSLPVGGRPQLLAKVAQATGLAGDQLLGVPGFYRDQRGHLALNGAAGLLVPVVGHDGLIVGLQVRADNPGDGTPKYTWLSSRAKGGPGAVMAAHCPAFSREQWMASQVANGDRKIARLTEGPIKGVAAQARTGIWTPAVPGVSQWGLAIPAFEREGVEVIRLAFDADSQTNPHVAVQLAQCVRGLVAHGFAVEVETWNIKDGKGIDDLLGKGGTPKVLVGVEAFTFAIAAPGRLGREATVDPEHVHGSVAWYVENADGDRFYADTDLLDAVARIERSDKALFGRIESLLRKKPRQFPIKPFKGAIKGRCSPPKRAARPGSGEELYIEKGGCLYRTVDKTLGEQSVESEVKVAQFHARITEHIARHECGTINHQYRIVATKGSGGEMTTSEVVIDASDYDGMTWTSKLGGGVWIIEPGKACRDFARHGIQVLSERDGIASVIVSTSLGWFEHEGQNLYLHGGGCIGADGPSDAIRVELNSALAKYKLPDPPSDPELLREAVRAHFGLFDLAKPDRQGARPMTGCVVAVPVRSILKRTDFGVHFSGITATGKTTTARLVYQHHAAGVTAKDGMPAAWSSTLASLQRHAHDCQNATLVVDELKGEQAVATATEFFQVHGNSRGRDRASKDMRIAPILDPRCGLLSTGETDPTSGSTLGRMLTVRFSRDTLHLPTKDRCEADGAAGKYATTIAGYIRWLAKGDRLGEVLEEHDRLAAEITERFKEAAASHDVHSRQPGVAAELAAGYRPFLRFAVEIGAINECAAKAYADTLDGYLIELVLDQAEAQVEGQPARKFIELLTTGLSSKRFHLIDANSDNAPAPYAGSCGWTKRWLYSGGDGGRQYLDWDIPNGSRLLGFIDVACGEIYLSKGALTLVAQSVSKDQGERYENPTKIGRDLFEAKLLRTCMEKQPDGSFKLRHQIKKRVNNHGNKWYYTLPIEHVFGRAEDDPVE